MESGGGGGAYKSDCFTMQLIISIHYQADADMAKEQRVCYKYAAKNIRHQFSAFSCADDFFFF